VPRLRMVWNSTTFPLSWGDPYFYH